MAASHVVIRFPIGVGSDAEFPIRSEKWDVACDAHVLVRETTPWELRERWAKIRSLRYDMCLERELNRANQGIDYEEDQIQPVTQLSWFGAMMDAVATAWCRFAHTDPKYRLGEQYSQCPTCKRKYAIPWANLSKTSNDVYVAAPAFISPSIPTRQVLCRNGVIDFA